MTDDTVRQLLDHCRRALGDDLRVLTRYGEDLHEFVYTREDLAEAFDDASRGVYRYPLADVHDGVWRMNRLHHSLDEPDVVAYTFGDVRFLQFPVTRTEGILVTHDLDSAAPEDFLTECEAIVADGE